MGNVIYKRETLILDATMFGGVKFSIDPAVTTHVVATSAFAKMMTGKTVMQDTTRVDVGDCGLMLYLPTRTLATSMVTAVQKAIAAPETEVRIVGSGVSRDNEILRRVFGMGS